MSKRPHNSIRSEESFDLMREIEIPDFMFEAFEKDSYDNFIDTNMSSEEKQLSQKIAKKLKSLNKQNKRENPKNILLYQKYLDLQNSQNQNSQEKRQKIENKDLKGKQYSKNYRQKKKQIMKGLEQENRFLKQKIDDLSFRLKQAELEIAKLKYSQVHKPQMALKMKQQCLKEIQSSLKNQKTSQKVSQYEKKFNNIQELSIRHRFELLDYFMNQFFETLISDAHFYFLNGMIQKTGLSRVDQKVPVSFIDLEIYQIYEINNFQQLQTKVISAPQPYIQELKKFKKYAVDLNKMFEKLIAQAHFLENASKQKINHDRNNLKVVKQTQNFLKLQIYFERVKYRKDVRLMRSSWFRQSQIKQDSKKKYPSTHKKSKIN